MHISKISIKGFRSFGPLINIPIREKLTAFIGQNSAGKTTALEALRKVFGLHSERELYRDDFHVGPDEDIEVVTARELSIEVQFHFDSRSDKDSIAHFFSDMVIDGNGKSPYLRTRLEATWTKSTLHQEGDIESKFYFINVSEGAAETAESKRLFPNHLRQLVQVLYVPAIRKPADQIKYSSGSMLYRVLRKIKWDAKFKASFDKKIDEIGTLFSKLDEFNTIQTSINSFWNLFHKDSRYKETMLGFGQSDFDSVLKRMEVTFSPTATDRPFKVDDLGEGYRSLFYLTLVCALLEIEDLLSGDDDDIGITRPLITLIAVEEPENHIAPQLLGRVTGVLKKMAHTQSAQVFLSSHTPAIVKRISPEAICHFRIDQYQTQVSTIELPDQKDEAYKYVKEAVHHFPEMYFASIVVIGEGDSEQVIIERLAGALNLNLDDNMITFVPLGHRFVNHIWKLLRVLRIPFVTILDLDLDRPGGGWGRIHYAIQQLLNLGIAPNKLLELSGGKVMTQDEFDEMPTWEYDSKTMEGWVQMLERYYVFFSGQLDIDFLMLEHYAEYYKKAVPAKGGPNIPDKSTKPEKHSQRVTAAVQATLKSDKATGASYSLEQRELMIWYQYHFLGRGKPVTHILVLSEMKDEDVKNNMPAVLGDVCRAVKKLAKRP